MKVCLYCSSSRGAKAVVVVCRLRQLVLTATATMCFCSPIVLHLPRPLPPPLLGRKLPHFSARRCRVTVLPLKVLPTVPPPDVQHAYLRGKGEKIHPHTLPFLTMMLLPTIELFGALSWHGEKVK